MHIVGIDLGTTHCAMAEVDPSGGAGAPVRDVPVPQLVRAGEVAQRPLLPSALYVPAPGELPEGALRLPWGEDDRPAGEFARWQGARVPGRQVASAKSWLCHPGVDRQAEILPWGAPPEVPKMSPVEASARLLRHLAHAWQMAHPGERLGDQEVVLTVPASFDEAARALTVSAARQAGLEKFTLLEEPQAAFYDFTARHRAQLGEVLSGVRLVLVVDVGGGTTDFTLVHAAVLPEGPVLKRLAVGDHLLLGGDNMDAALARRAEEKLGRRLSAAQWTQLVQAARNAKEQLLGERPPEKVGLALVAEGSRLFGGTLSTELTRAEAEQLVLDGFFPRTAVDETPKRATRMALQELGLPYAQDPAVTRHLAAFLRQHALAGFAALGVEAPPPGALPRPDAILLNGGVFNSPRITERLVDAVSAWWPDAPRIRLLEHASLDLAVARGAAYYGLARRGFGLKIGGGAARAYYVGLGKADANDDMGPLGVCLIPRGFEEGENVDLGQRTFQLTLGRPVQFQIYATTADRIDKPGDLAEIGDVETFRPLPPIHTLLKSANAAATSGGATVPVHLKASLTEIGTLELFCVSNVADERWRLEFELRGRTGQAPIAITESMPARFSEATEAVHRVYGHKPIAGVGPKDVKQLGKALERALGPRESWRVPVLRELWSALYAGASKRRRSADHERVFYQQLGFALRPGFGYPLDDWRVEQTFGLFKDLVQFHTEKAVWIEFWVMWRRVAGGLSEAAQQELWRYLRPHLERRVPPDVKPGPKQKGIVPEGLDEMVRAVASLEHLSPSDKAEVGRWIAERVQHPQTVGGPWAWALGRLGARQPLYGSSHKTVEPELAAEWIRLLVGLGLTKIDGAPFAVAQLARRTGDRMRDVDDETRALALEALSKANAAESWRRMVEEVISMEAADEARALGDTLPAGLMLG
ncbi:MAG: hsp70 family protein [Myxococcaceae bacterium]|nr:hsp70 family protein [Myxococcaceae bacterium]